MRAVSILLWALALLICITWTSRTISSFRCSHDIITEMSKSGKMKLPKSFKFHSFVLTKQKSSFSFGQNSCSPGHTHVYLHQCHVPQAHFPAGPLGCSRVGEFGRHESPGPRALQASAQYDDPPGLTTEPPTTQWTQCLSHGMSECRHQGYRQEHPVTCSRPQGDKEKREQSQYPGTAPQKEAH